MNQTASTKPVTAPHSALLLPAAYLVHFAEEWFGGLHLWAGEVLGTAISVDRFLAINGAGFVIFVTGTLAAYLSPAMAWLAVAIAALFGLNAILHTLATLYFGSYSPGMVSGLLIYLPLSFFVLRQLAARLPAGTLAMAVVVGVLMHGLATWTALA